jgi:hypothetical protein
LPLESIVNTIRPAAALPDAFEGNGQMLAIAISLLFGFAAFAAVTVIHASVLHGARRARLILAELAADEARHVVPITPASGRRGRALFAVA